MTLFRLLSLLGLVSAIAAAGVTKPLFTQSVTLFETMQKDLKNYNSQVEKVKDTNETKASFAKRQKLIQSLNSNAKKVHDLVVESIKQTITGDYNGSLYVTVACDTVQKDIDCLETAVSKAQTALVEDFQKDLHSYLKQNYAVSDLNLTVTTPGDRVEKIEKTNEPSAWKLRLFFLLKAATDSNISAKVPLKQFKLDPKFVDSNTSKAKKPAVQPTLLLEPLVGHFHYDKPLGDSPFTPETSCTVEGISQTQAAADREQEHESDKTKKLTLSLSKGKKGDKATLTQIIQLRAQNKSLLKRAAEAKEVSTQALSQLKEAKEAIADLESRLKNAGRSHGFYLDGTANLSFTDTAQQYAGPRARIGYTLGNHSFGISYESLNLIDNPDIYDEFNLFGFNYSLRDGKLHAGLTIGGGDRKLQNRIDYFRKFGIPFYAALDLFVRIGERGFYLDLGLGMQIWETDLQNGGSSLTLSQLNNYTINEQNVAGRVYVRIGLQ